MTTALRRGRSAPLAVVLLLLLAACGTGTGTGTPGLQPGASDPGAHSGLSLDLDVDTPALRRAKQRAGMDDCPSGTSDAAAPEGGLPDLVLPCLGGGPDVTLAGLRGPMVVNLWAQWCGPCREELPYYQRLHEQGRVSVLGLDYQDVRPEAALELAAETGVTYPSVADPGGDVRAPLRVRGLPGLVLLDARGRVVHQEFVVIESYEQLAGLVEQHLGVAVGDDG